MITTEVAVPIGTLAVAHRGRATGPTVVLVHGYPDTSRLWEPVARELASDHHVVVYDVRGAGASSAPPDRAGYRMPELLRDLRAVVDAVVPGERVHLVGHDWGAIQGFAALGSLETAPRIASFTALSAPGIEVVRSWARARIADRSLGSAMEVAGQLARSWYVLAFQVPELPERLVRRTVVRLLRLGGHPAPSPTVVEDAVRGIELYRANTAYRAETGDAAAAPRAPGPGGGTRAPGVPDGVPVQVVIGRDDRYVSARVFDELRDRGGVPVHEVDGGHWLPLTHPGVVAGHVRALTGEP